LLVVRLGRNAGCHLVLDIIFPPFRMIAPLAKFIDWYALQFALRESQRDSNPSAQGCTALPWVNRPKHFQP
jgi:hypothetical protein